MKQIPRPRVQPVGPVERSLDRRAEARLLPKRGRSTLLPYQEESLSDQLDGAVLSNRHGEVFLWEKRLGEISSDGELLCEGFLSALSVARAWAEEEPPRFLSPLAEAAPESLLFLDAETCGWLGRPLILVGLLRYADGDFVLTQAFARDYSEERALLAQVRPALEAAEILVSFNGKSFDWPFLRDRLAYHRLRFAPQFHHLDLLHPARRRWRRTLPNCRLVTLERHICGRWRSGDIPSSEIPRRYQEFVLRRDPRLIAPVFHHNRLDLLTLAQLLVTLTRTR